MKAPPLAKNYGCLTPEERFRLIMAASGRGDEAERNRLKNAGERITLSIQDHAPYAQAFDELAFLIFIELLDEAARYRDAFALADDTGDNLGADEAGEEESDDAAEETAAQADEGPAEDDRVGCPLCFRPTSPVACACVCGGSLDGDFVRRPQKS